MKTFSERVSNSTPPNFSSRNFTYLASRTLCSLLAPGVLVFSQIVALEATRPDAVDGERNRCNDVQSGDSSDIPRRAGAGIGPPFEAGEDDGADILNIDRKPVPPCDTVYTLSAR